MLTFNTFKERVLSYGTDDEPLMLPTVNIRGTKRGDIFTIYGAKKLEFVILKGIVLTDLNSLKSFIRVEFT